MLSYLVALSLISAAGPAQVTDPLVSVLPGQLIPQDQSVTVCPDGASAFRMIRDGYYAGNGIIDVERYFTALRINRCEQLSGPAMVTQVIQVKRVAYANRPENVFALVKAEDVRGRSLYGIYEPALSDQPRVDSVLDSALHHAENGHIGGDISTYYVCPNTTAARRTVQNVPAKNVAPEHERVRIFEANLTSEGCGLSSMSARLADAYEFVGFAAGDTMGGTGAYSGDAVTADGQRRAIVLVVSF